MELQNQINASRPADLPTITATSLRAEVVKRLVDNYVSGFPVNKIKWLDEPSPSNKTQQFTIEYVKEITNIKEVE